MLKLLPVPTCFHNKANQKAPHVRRVMRGYRGTIGLKRWHGIINSETYKQMVLSRSCFFMESQKNRKIKRNQQLFLSKFSELMQDSVFIYTAHKVLPVTYIQNDWKFLCSYVILDREKCVLTSMSCLSSTSKCKNSRNLSFFPGAHSSDYSYFSCMNCAQTQTFCLLWCVVLSSSPAFIYHFCFILLRVTKVKLDLLVLLALRVPRVHAAPLETQEKMDPVAPLENQ